MNKITNQGKQLIKDFEGFRKQIYHCLNGLPTIGYGHVLLRGESKWYSHGISIEEAEKLLRQDIKIVENCIGKVLKVPVNENQFDALVSLVFNIGCTAFKNSTMLRKLNNLDYDGAAREFSRWVHVNGVVSRGLVRRRQAEVDLFCRAVH